MEDFGPEGNAVVEISTSGNSGNKLLALEYARALGCNTVGLLGHDGRVIKQPSDLAVIVPSLDTARIHETHIMAGNITCDLVEQFLAA